MAQKQTDRCTHKVPDTATIALRYALLDTTHICEDGAHDSILHLISLNFLFFISVKWFTNGAASFIIGIMILVNRHANFAR
jgi:hypothetical protein